MAGATWVRLDLVAGAFTLAVNGGLLAGEQSGDDPALVLLHGFGGSRKSWDRLCAALPRDLALLRYDLRGFGASTADEGLEFSHADDLLRLLDARGIARVALAGLSLGGGVAAHFALCYPERVSRLILINPALMGWKWSGEWRARWHDMVKAARAGDMALARRQWLAHPLFATTRASDAAAELSASIEAFAGRQWLADPQRAVLPEVERLHLLAVPTLLLTGARDLPDFRLIGDLLEASAPDIRRIDYPDAGHMLPLERAHEVAEAMAEFICR